MVYDLIIIGTGPAGLTAGAYAGRVGLETIFFENGNLGGELVNRGEIRSYPGFPDGISGSDLRSKLVSQVEQYDHDVFLTSVEEIDPGTPHTVRTSTNEYQSWAVIVATGSQNKPLDVPGEEKYDGRGVFYCAKCDGPLYRNKRIAVAGGNSHALIDALYLTTFASEVVVFESECELTADESLRTEVESHEDVTVQRETEITELLGDDGVLTGLQVEQGGSERHEPVGGLYIHIGSEPNTSFIDGTAPLAEDGSVIVDETMATEIEGIFAAGDVRTGSPREVAAAVGDGTVAIESATQYLVATNRLEQH